MATSHNVGVRHLLMTCACLLATGMRPSSSHDVELCKAAQSSFTVDGQRGAIHVMANQYQVPLGTHFELTISITNRSDRPLPVFNLRLSSLTARYLKVALFDADKEYVGNLLMQSAGMSNVSYRNHDMWCHIPPHETYILHRRFFAGSTSWFGTATGLVKLLPGRYFIQVIVERRFFSESPWDRPYRTCGCAAGPAQTNNARRNLPTVKPENIAEALADVEERRAEMFNRWYRKYPEGILARSNVVEIEFVSLPVEAPMPEAR